MRGLLRNVFASLGVVAVIIVSGCAGSLSALPTEDELQGLKGQSKQAIVERLGQPTRKSTDSNGQQTWEYKRPATSQSSFNKFVAVSSFGMMSGDNSVYVDILRLTFSNDRVKTTALDENVTNVSLPGSGK